ncbi:MAG: outer membrane lipoprotein carrier protein LolA [Chlorobi bacterium]|nr:outer membrane lipoprotein carrier protein LolA [Chlorobiota bacterium]
MKVIKMVKGLALILGLAITGWAIAQQNPQGTQQPKQQTQQTQQSQQPTNPGPHPVRLTKEMAQQVSDPEAKKILEKTSKKFSKLKSFQVKFRLKLDMPETDDDEIKEGTLYVNGEKYRLDFGDQLVVSDGKTVWTYIKETNEVQITEEDPENQMFQPRDLFSDFGDEYIYTLLGTKKLKDYTTYVIDLTPIDKNKSFFKIRLYIDTKTYEIRRAIVFEKSGIRYALDIISFIPNAPIPNVLFTFDTTAYPGIQVTDLR